MPSFFMKRNLKSIWIGKAVVAGFYKATGDTYGASSELLSQTTDNIPITNNCSFAKYIKAGSVVSLTHKSF